MYTSIEWSSFGDLNFTKAFEKMFSKKPSSLTSKLECHSRFTKSNFAKNKRVQLTQTASKLARLFPQTFAKLGLAQPSGVHLRVCSCPYSQALGTEKRFNRSKHSSLFSRNYINQETLTDGSSSAVEPLAANPDILEVTRHQKLLH